MRATKSRIGHPTLPGDVRRRLCLYSALAAAGSAALPGSATYQELSWGAPTPVTTAAATTAATFTPREVATAAAAGTRSSYNTGNTSEPDGAHFTAASASSDSPYPATLAAGFQPRQLYDAADLTSHTDGPSWSSLGGSSTWLAAGVQVSELREGSLVVQGIGARRGSQGISAYQPEALLTSAAGFTASTLSSAASILNTSSTSNTTADPTGDRSLWSGVTSTGTRNLFIAAGAPADPAAGAPADRVCVILDYKGIVNMNTPCGSINSAFKANLLPAIQNKLKAEPSTSNTEVTWGDVTCVGTMLFACTKQVQPSKVLLAVNETLPTVFNDLFPPEDGDMNCSKRPMGYTTAAAWRLMLTNSVSDPRKEYGRWDCSNIKPSPCGKIVAPVPFGLLDRVTVRAGGRRGRRGGGPAHRLARFTGFAMS